MWIFTFGFVCLAFSTVSSQSCGPRLLFPTASRQYYYAVKTNISCGTLGAVESESHWTLEGRLLVQVYDNFTRVRYTLSDLKTSIYGKNMRSHTRYNPEAGKDLQKPWEVDYKEDGNINSLYVTENEPLWTANMKRALSINFQLKKDLGTYYNQEPCLYDVHTDCQVVYVSSGTVIRKFNSLHILSEHSGYTSWMSVPKDYTKAYFGGPVNFYAVPGEYSGPLDNIGTADRVYEMDDKVGLLSLDLKSVFQHKTRSHILAVITELSLNYDADAPLERIDKLDLKKIGAHYVGMGYTDPTNGIRNETQDSLRNTTYQTLLRIASEGIDADNIVKNASKIHNLDFVNLLKTMSQLDFAALRKLMDDMVLGTSYEIETSRNIFLEVLPHVRTNACARLIKHLLTETSKYQQKIEDTTLLSLIRKLPFNVANHSQELLEDLEVFTRLSLDLPPEIRHAGILSFATLVYKATEAGRVKQDYLDSVVVKYFRMYSSCPQYIDRLVWLQGLTNIQYSIDTYVWTVYNNVSYDRHERFWAVYGTIPLFASSGFAPTWHILMNEKEHIQIRIAALHSFLSSRIKPSELLSVHNYIQECKDDELKRFWYTTVTSLENSKTYNPYRVASNYLNFLTGRVSNPGPKFWATSNHIVGTYSDESATGAMVHLMSVGDTSSGFPVLLHIRVKTVNELMATSDLGIFIKAEGVATNMYKKIRVMEWESLNVEKLAEVLKKMKVQTVQPEKVHIEIVVKVHDKTVYATHFNQSRFDSWNGEELTKSVEDFFKFGSHINQQIVYYPFQLDASIPTELGTPIRLQTAIVSFSSLRGNLTAPTNSDLTWRNDLQLRYTGLAVTSLCTEGPLLRSGHVARVQQAAVASLPVKFTVALSLPRRLLQIKWPNPGSQGAGLAMHSRAQIAMDSAFGQETYTVNSPGSKYQMDESGVIFDCDKPMTGTEVLQKLFTTNSANYDILTKLRPSHFILNGIVMLSAPPAGSCGLMLGGRKPPSADHALTVYVGCEKLAVAPDNKVEVDLIAGLLFGETKQNGTAYLNVTGGFHLVSTDQNTTIDVDVTGHQPGADNPAMRNWKFCLQHKDHKSTVIDSDISSSASPHAGQVSLTFASGAGLTCPAAGSLLQLRYRGEQKLSANERMVELKMFGSKLPKLGVLSENGFYPHPAVSSLLTTFEKEPLNVTAVIKENDGIATLSMNQGTRMQFKAEDFSWLLDNWGHMQLMKEFGIYRECRLQESTVLTMLGVLDRLPPLDCAESLVLADCTERPRFAVLRTKSRGIKLYTGGNSASVTRSRSALVVLINDKPVNCSEGCVYPPGEAIYDFKITVSQNKAKLHSRVSGIEVYYSLEETVVLAPHSYMSTACGSCMAQHYYRLC